MKPDLKLPDAYEAFTLPEMPTLPELTDAQTRVEEMWRYASKGRGIVKIAPTGIDWSIFRVDDLENPYDKNPTEWEIIDRWCVLYEDIARCGPTVFVAIFFSDGVPNLISGGGDEMECTVAEKMVARLCNLTSNKPLVLDVPKAPIATNDNRKPPARFYRTSTTTLMQTAFADIKWIIPSYVPEGLVLLAGKQKLGKTWMAIDWAAAVATGGRTMGIECERGDVLYIDMENGERRIQRRIFAMWPLKQTRPDLTRLEWANVSPVIGKDFFTALDEWYVSVEKPRLVIIDVFQRVKPAGSAAKNAYENDYAALTGLQQWATLRSVAVVALHHLKKGNTDSDDPFEKLSGSNGLSACADTTLVLDRNSQGCTLYARGRDVEEIESAVTFDKTAFRWRVQGNVTDVRRSDERANILLALADAGEAMSPNVIADVTGMKPGNVRRLLLSMVTAGEAQKTGRGKYAHPDVTAEPHALGNKGNKVTTPEDNRVCNEVTGEMTGDGDTSLDEAIDTDVTGGN